MMDQSIMSVSMNMNANNIKHLLRSQLENEENKNFEEDKAQAPCSPEFNKRACPDKRIDFDQIVGPNKSLCKSNQDILINHSF